MSLETRLFEVMIDRHPEEAARALGAGPPGAAADALLAAAPRSAARVLTSMSPHFAVGVVDAMPPPETKPLLDHLEPDVLTRLLRSLSVEKRGALLELLDKDLAASLGPLLDAREQTAGALLSSRALALPEDLPVSGALERIRSSPELVRYYVHVTDDRRRLVGVLNLKELFLAPPGALLREVSRDRVERLRETADLRTILSHPGWARFHSLPVVDEEDVFLGVITYRTARDIAADILRRQEESLSSTVRALADLFLTGAGGVVQAMASAVSLGAAASRRS